MSETSVAFDLLHSFQVLSQFGIQGVRYELSEPSISDVSLSVQEPFGNVVVYIKTSWYNLKSIVTSWSGKNIIDFFNFLFGHLSSSIQQELMNKVPKRNKKCAYLLLRSTCATLRTKLENLLPIPLMTLRANMTFLFPSTLVF